MKFCMFDLKDGKVTAPNRATVQAEWNNPQASPHGLMLLSLLVGAAPVPAALQRWKVSADPAIRACALGYLARSGPQAQEALLQLLKLHDLEGLAIFGGEACKTALLDRFEFDRPHAEVFSGVPDQIMGLLGPRGMAWVFQWLSENPARKGAAEMLGSLPKQLGKEWCPLLEKVANVPDPFIQKAALGALHYASRNDRRQSFNRLAHGDNPSLRKIILKEGRKVLVRELG